MLLEGGGPREAKEAKVETVAREAKELITFGITVSHINLINIYILRWQLQTMLTDMEATGMETVQPATQIIMAKRAQKVAQVRKGLKEAQVLLETRAQKGLMQITVCLVLKAQEIKLVAPIQQLETAAPDQ